MTNRYRAGQPADLPIIDFAGDEPEDEAQINGDFMAVVAWVFLILIALFLIAVFAGYWSIK